MQQLSPLDASFIYLENGNQFMHVAGLSLYDPSTVPDGRRMSRGDRLGFGEILKLVDETLSFAPYARRKLVRVPGDLDHPYWVEDENFDLEFHVRHIAIPKPGDWKQLCILIARLHSRPLDMSKPLWEIYVIEGLDSLPGMPPGCFGVYSKTHHAAIDGASGADIQTLSHTLHPEDDLIIPEEDKPWESERTPSDLEFLFRAHVNNLRQAGPSRELARKAIAGLFNAGKEITSGRIKAPSAAPKTRFNGSVSANRVFDARAFDIDKFREIKRSVEGTTINDVVLAICGGALRKYLMAKDELPADSLVAMAPINTRTEAETHSGGNMVSSMFVPIGSEIEDPLERLRVVHESALNSKELTKAMDARAMSESVGLIAPAWASLGARIATSAHLAERFGNQPANLTITNVPGPQMPLYYAGAKLIGTFGMGPVVDGQNLFVCVQSFSGVLTISATADRVAMPDPDFFMECVTDAYRELKEVALGSTKRSDKPMTHVTKKRQVKSATKKAARKKSAGKKTTGKKAVSKKVTGKKTGRKKAAGKKVAGKKVIKKGASAAI